MIVCDDLGAEADPLEQRDEDGRIGGRERGADEEAGRERHAEDGGRDAARQERGEHDPRYDKHEQPDRNLAQDGQRELQPTVEEDEGDAEGQDELRAHGVERDVDRARDRGPEQRSRSEQEQHRRDAQQLREELGAEPGREHQRDREDDVLRRHVARL